MDDLSQQATQPATQQATQPYEDPRRRGRTLSEMSEHEIADVICVLHQNSPRALEAIKATMRVGPEHILQNEDLEGITDDDWLVNPDLGQRPREIALRMSSTVKKPQEGFLFGRTPDRCDVLLTDDPHDRLISNVHFRIFVNAHGSLMLQDLSTNGTIIDDDHLCKADRRMAGPRMRALRNGAIICVLGGLNRQEIKFMLRIPSRGGIEDLYEQKLRGYLTARGQIAQFASMRESTFGNHWNGGSTYNFTGLLGKGAFATVYRVQTKDQGTVYAAKELDKRRFIKNGILDLKFDSELKIMRGLKHPNIVDYVDCQMHSNWIYIIMEFIPGGELSKELQDRRFLPEHEVQQITRQTLHALDYIHGQGITHRDIKPDNILIASRNPLIVKLSDFGLSKCVSDQETFLKTFCGTLLYCAPEVYPDYGNYAQGTAKRRRFGEPPLRTSPYDSSVDMWSFGAVIFHLLCGKAPVIGKGDNRGAQMLENIMTKEIDFNPLRKLDVSEAAVDFIRALLNRNPTLRPKERECLRHRWLIDVPDYFNYEHVVKLEPLVGQRLPLLSEEDEDDYDEDLLNELKELAHHQSLNARLEQSSPASPARPMKRPKVAGDEVDVPANVLYPMLPQASSGVLPATGPRLFGEITASLLKSSGVFGNNAVAPVASEMPEISSQMEQVSVNDFENVERPKEPPTKVLRRAHLALNGSTGLADSAPSLLGAEAQLGQMNMQCVDVEHSNMTTPDSVDPVTPQTRELSVSSSLDRSAISTDLAPQLHDELEERRISMELLGDEEAFAATVQGRQAMREENARVKAQTFNGHPMSRNPISSADFARTIDARTGFEARSFGAATAARDDRSLLSRRAIQIASDTSSDGIDKPPQRYGKLTPLPGSFAKQKIYLSGRLTSWGRGEGTHVRYPDLKDTRVPKYALKITFWARGVEPVDASGGDWTQIPGIRTLISTSASSCIYINDVPLTKESLDGTTALYGKLYSGDIITIYQSEQQDVFLKYLVEITFGDSARPRPNSEKGFVIQREYHHHQRMKHHGPKESTGFESMTDDHEDENEQTSGHELEKQPLSQPESDFGSGKTSVAA